MKKILKCAHTHTRITHVHFYLYTHCVSVWRGCVCKCMPPLKSISFEGSLQWICLLWIKSTNPFQNNLWQENFFFLSLKEKNVGNFSNHLAKSYLSLAGPEVALPHDQLRVAFLSRSDWEWHWKENREKCFSQLFPFKNPKCRLL